MLANVLYMAFLCLRNILDVNCRHEKFNIAELIRYVYVDAKLEFIW